MEDPAFRLSVGLICAGLVPSSCQGGAEDRRSCQGGVCVDIELEEPVGFDVPVKAILTVTTERDIEGLWIAIGSLDPALLVEGGEVLEDFSYWTWKKWQVDAKAGEPIRRSTQVRFTQEGWFFVDGFAWASDTDFIRDAVPVQMTAAGGTPYPTPRTDPIATLEKLEETSTPSGQGQGSQIEQQSTGVILHEQTFEGAFPAAAWTLRDASPDGYDRTWDDDNYRAHQGAWAAWPANGGKDAVKPSPGNDNYPNNLDSWMIYGPFDLSDAVGTYVSFWRWREIEQDLDFLKLEISFDGVARFVRNIACACPDLGRSSHPGVMLYFSWKDATQAPEVAPRRRTGASWTDGCSVVA